jgi:hypothetical protein
LIEQKIRGMYEIHHITKKIERLVIRKTSSSMTGMLDNAPLNPRRNLLEGLGVWAQACAFITAPPVPKLMDYAIGRFLTVLALRRCFHNLKRCQPMTDETERRKLIALDMRLRLRDSRDPILAAKDAEARRQHDAPALREAAREALRQLGRAEGDDR